MKLLPGEKLSFDKTEEPDPASLSDNAINKKYAKGEVRIVTEQARYPLPSIPVMLSSNNYELNPEFQRRHRWDISKKSRLIESFIMNVPIPPIFLYEDRYSHYEVMDGLQRLTAINDFYTDQLKLDNLEEWPELNGRTYSTLPEQVRRGVDRRYLSSIILLQETAKSEVEAQRLKQLVFERINSGGINLEPQEARNAIYNGPLNQLCIDLARNPHLCATWGIPKPTPAELKDGQPSKGLLANEIYRQMEDVELVLRFFAHRQRIENHKGPLRTYLDNYLRLGNEFQNKTLSGLKEIFVDTIKLAHDTFGTQSFWLWRKRKSGSWNWLKRPTTVVYDPLMSVLSQHLDHSSKIISRRELFVGGIKKFYEKNYNTFEGRYTNRSNLGSRNELFETFVSDILEK
ncbi:DUF262 domain-containing protein [Myxococcus landrumensis]|uniref:DUF262 domain-containing protein n=1 Tax=Myxococcus landrumensis TaxID=2813577 RepID=A0ABX7NF66_9BACT|nr:DUF262 domain-containing protein [Myxococcus landrumus]QSQ17477.1 DUF262 domain-containing protein [Myxococcus landrumus]